MIQTSPKREKKKKKSAADGTFTSSSAPSLRTQRAKALRPYQGERTTGTYA